MERTRAKEQIPPMTSRQAKRLAAEKRKANPMTREEAQRLWIENKIEDRKYAAKQKAAALKQSAATRERNKIDKIRNKKLGEGQGTLTNFFKANPAALSATIAVAEGRVSPGDTIAQKVNSLEFVEPATPPAIRPGHIGYKTPAKRFQLSKGRKVLGSPGQIPDDTSPSGYRYRVPGSPHSITVKAKQEESSHNSSRVASVATFLPVSAASRSIKKATHSRPQVESHEVEDAEELYAWNDADTLDYIQALENIVTPIVEQNGASVMKQQITTGRAEAVGEVEPVNAREKLGADDQMEVEGQEDMDSDFYEVGDEEAAEMLRVAEQAELKFSVCKRD